MNKVLIEKSDKYKYEVSIIDNKTKIFSSPEANYVFDMNNGNMITFGKTLDDDGVKFPAPNILDIEITDICTGINGKVCPFCYKANLPTNGNNMSFETFKKILEVYPKSLTQIAFGADSTLKSNPDIWRMMEYSRSLNIIPNVTAAQIDDETADKLATYCGAVAISRYHDKDVCYDSIKRLTDRGMKQINMHFMIAEETYERALETLEDIKNDPRLSKLNAIVFLSLKKKGRGVGFHTLSQEKFNNLIKIARDYKIGVGFDSCSSLKALRAYEDDPQIKSCVLDCESTLHSSYINVHGYYYPCSFCEGEGDWKEGINVLDCTSTDDFLDKVWNHEKTERFRNILLHTACNNKEHCRTCPYYEV